jgi:UDP-GlcNAc:undecaprenyl-phosphate GlcNAc-1-phosphate transferase
MTGLLTDHGMLAALMLCATGVGLIGFADDQASIAPLTRILLLIVFLALAFFVDPGLIAGRLNWGSFEPTPIPVWGYCVLLALTTVGIVNAVNMADGQNGLVPSMFVVWALCLVMVGDPLVAQAALILAILSFVILLFNLRGSLFLGDCGSYGVTFLLGLLTVLSHAEGRVSIETATVWFFIPVVDCLRLILTRSLQGRSPMAPDTDHFHHRLQAKLGDSYGLVAYICSVAGCSIISAIAPQFALVCLIVLASIYFSFAWLAESTAMVADGQVDDGLFDLSGDFTNVVPLVAEKSQSRDSA